MILPLLRERLIFGTGRLAGGAYASRSKALIAACQAAGIVRFDTAPSYGMGAAEELLGSAVGAGSIIHTKVGSSRPAWSSLRGWAKYLRNSVHNRATVERVNIAPLRFQEPDHAMDFSPAAIVRSLNRSRRLLRRDRLDLVLLHEAEPWQLLMTAFPCLRPSRKLEESANWGLPILARCCARTPVGWRKLCLGPRRCWGAEMVVSTIQFFGQPAAAMQSFLRNWNRPRCRLALPRRGPRAAI